MEKIGLALIGCGYWGKNHLRTLHSLPNVNLKYVHDVGTPVVPIPENVKFTQDINEVLNDPEVSGVVIAVPTEHHYDVAMKAINAGKHIFIEKPFTRSFEEANRINAAAKEKGLSTMVGHIFKYNKPIKYIKNKIDQGEIGKIKYIDARRVSLGPIREKDSALWDLTTHDIYIATYLIGEQPTHVSCVGNSFHSGVDDTVSLNMRFPGNAFVSVYANWGHPIKERKITIGGTQKAILFDDIQVSDKIQIYDRGIEYLPNPKDYTQFQSGIREGDILIPRIELEEPLKAELNHFVNCIQGKEICLSSGEEGAQVVKILEAAEKSSRNGGVEIAIE